MQRRWIRLENIHVLDNRRALNLDKVNQIAESIKAVGLINPPSVRIVEEMVIDGEEWGSVPVLIAGRHRVEALKQIGEDSVECVVYADDALQAEMVEIDENLARSELTAAEESAYILRRKEIWDRINGGKTGETFASLGGRGNKAFAAEIAEITGEDKSGINRKIARARELGDGLLAVVGTSLDKGVELDALIKLPEQDRKALIERASSGEDVSARNVSPSHEGMSKQSDHNAIAAVRDLVANAISRLRELNSGQRRLCLRDLDVSIFLNSTEENSL